MSEGTHYERLGVGPTATFSEIRAAFRQRARQFHPDVSAASSAEMAAMNEAWAVLSDPARRARYDAGLIDDAGSVTDEDDPAPAAPDLDDHLPPNSAIQLFARMITITVLVVIVLLTILFVYAFSRSGFVGTG